MISYPKTQRTDSNKLRRAVASLPCMNCGKEGETQAKPYGVNK